MPCIALAQLAGAIASTYTAQVRDLQLTATLQLECAGSLRDRYSSAFSACSLTVSCKTLKPTRLSSPVGIAHCQCRTHWAVRGALLLLHLLVLLLLLLLLLSEELWLEQGHAGSLQPALK